MRLTPPSYGKPRVSRCTIERDTPLTWWFRPAPNVDVADEIRASLEGLTDLEREVRFGELLATMKLAQYGQLVGEGDDLKPIARDPDIWELRWTFGRDLFRLYHGEPDERPQHLIGLHFHKKLVTGTDQEVQDDQNKAISTAVLRYRSGQSNDWGI